MVVVDQGDSRVAQPVVHSLDFSAQFGLGFDLALGKMLRGKK
jgi:hypothetical protein